MAKSVAMATESTIAGINYTTIMPSCSFVHSCLHSESTSQNSIATLLLTSNRD